MAYDCLEGTTAWFVATKALWHVFFDFRLALWHVFFSTSSHAVLMTHGKLLRIKELVAIFTFRVRVK